MKWIYVGLGLVAAAGIYVYKNYTITIYEDEIIEIPHWAKTPGGEDYIKSWSYMTSDGRIYD